MVLEYDARQICTEILELRQTGSAKDLLWVRISMRKDGGSTIYCIDQNADVATFPVEHIAQGIRPLKAPMPNKMAIYEDETEVPAT